MVDRMLFVKFSGVDEGILFCYFLCNSMLSEKFF